MKKNKVTAEEQREKLRKIKHALIGRPDYQEALERASRQPHVKAAEITAFGFKLTLQALSPGMVESILNVVENHKKASGM